MHKVRSDLLPRPARHNGAAMALHPRKMNRIVAEFFLAVALTMAAIIALASGARAGNIEVTEAFARASATPGAKTASLYLTLSNRGSSPDRLVAVATSAASMAHMHETENAGGVMKMRMVQGIDLAPGASVALKPGGMHIMLMGLRAPLKQGETLEMKLSFQNSDELKITVPIAGVAADGPGQAAGSSGN